jgi:hypothetical protein
MQYKMNAQPTTTTYKPLRHAPLLGFSKQINSLSKGTGKYGERDETYLQVGQGLNQGQPGQAKGDSIKAPLHMPEMRESGEE